MKSVFLFYPLFREEIDRLARDSEKEEAAYLVRIEKEVVLNEPVLSLILSCQTPEKFYYRTKEESFILGGLGKALVIEASQSEDILRGFSRLWEIDEKIPVFGGFSFDNEEDPAPEWESFGLFRFTLPLVEIKKTRDGAKVSVNCINEKGLTRRQALREIAASLQSLDALPRIIPTANLPVITGKQLIPEKPEWDTMIKKALRIIKEGDLKKIVLARKIIITLRDAWNPAQVVAALAGIKENSFTFFYQIKSDVAFLGRSPERLFRMQNGHILSEAIAGTRPRGKTMLEDQRLAAELLNTPKELEEHRFVAGFIEARMNQLCVDVRTEFREEIMKLQNVQHIITRFTGRSLHNQSPLSIAGTFHPSPAVGGFPQEVIRPYIRQHEPFRRGWYAAPIGWMNLKNADFAVGIRSALVNRHALHIFAGAGIVQQSDAHAEWSETEKKMDNFTAVLGENNATVASFR